MRHRGHSLMEMVLSLTILGIVTVSVGSVALLAGQSEPEQDSAAATLVTDSRTLARIAEDLAMARYVIEQGPNAVTIVVADRTGDGLPDRVRYAWSGSAATPLTVQLNNESAVTLIKYVDQFQLTYDLDQRVTTIPGSPGTPGPEVLIASYEDTGGSGRFDIKSDEFVAQSLTPALSPGAAGFQPTRIEVYGEASGNTDGEALVEVRDESSGEPGSAVYASGTLLETNTPDPFDWVNTDLTDTDTVPEGQAITLMVSYVSGSGRVNRLRTNTTGGGTLLSTTDGGSNWSADTGASLCYRLYGYEMTGGSGFDVTREHVTGIQVSLQSTADDNTPMTRTARLEQAPEVLTGFWDAEFDASPSNHDLNNDGSTDWVYNGGSGEIPADHLTGGVWSAHQPLRTNPVAALPTVVRVQARLSAGSAGQQSMIYGPFHTDGGGNVLPLISVLQQGTEGQELLIYNEQEPATPIATITDLGSDWVDLELTLLPNERVVHFVINGEDRGTAQLDWEADQGARGFWIDGSGTGAKFNMVRVTFGGSYTANADAPTQTLGGDAPTQPLDNGLNSLNNFLNNLFGL